MPFTFDGVARPCARGVHGDHARALNLAASVLGTFKKHAVQNHARVNDDGVAHFKLGALFVAGDELDGVNKFFWIGIVEQKREALDGFMSEAAAAGFFPREMLVKNVDGVAGAGQLFATHCAGRTAADDYDFSHQVALAKVRPCSSTNSSSDGENRQDQSSEEYSTENRGSRDGACLDAYYIGCHPLQNRKQGKVDHEKKECELRGV